MKYVKITKQNIEKHIQNYDLLVCRLRSSRNKAKHLAILEMATVLEPVDGIFIFNGPLGDVRGLISFFVKPGSDSGLIERLKTVGYCNRFYKLDFTLQHPDVTDEIKSINKYRWKGYEFNVVRFFHQCKIKYQEQSVSNREFAIYQGGNSIKYVTGYRGDGSEAGRRGLPIEDTRMMVNLACPHSINSLLDQFAGSGGIIYTAKTIRQSLFTISADIDRVVEPGLKMYSDLHYTCDARQINLKSNMVDAVVAEIPFSPRYTQIAIDAFLHILPSISQHGKLVCMCHTNQTEPIKQALKHQLYLLLDADINRKGTPVSLLVWSKDYEHYKAFGDYRDMLLSVI